MRFTYSERKMAKIFTNSGDPDQMPRSAASDLGLHCLPSTLLQVSRLQFYSDKYTMSLTYYDINFQSANTFFLQQTLLFFFFLK